MKGIYYCTKKKQIQAPLTDMIINICSKPGRQHEDLTIKHEKPLDALSAAEKTDDAYLSSVRPCSLDSTASKLSGVHKIVPSHASVSI